MLAPIALRQRGQFAQLLNHILHRARQLPAWREPNIRNLRTWRQLLLAILVCRSTLLLILAHALQGQRKARTIKALALGISYFLTHAQCAVDAFCPDLLEAILARLDATQLLRYRGKVLLVIDATEYPKRSRATGERPREMQYIGRVRKTGQTTETTTGYVDLWAGVVLRGKRFLPLTRRLFSSHHSTIASQNQVEQAVLDSGLAHLNHRHLAAIVVADRGFGRKGLLIQLAQRAQDFVIRIDADILVQRLSTQMKHLLADLLRDQPWLGEVVWNLGQAGRLRCRVRKLRAQIQDGRARRSDQQRASMTFVEVVPLDATVDPLVVATTVPVHRVVDAQGVVQVYEQRWAIETGFETMKSWGLGRFMVRQRQAIDRLLWMVAVAYALTLLALHTAHLASFRQQVIRVLSAYGVV
jgi:hypothetical protein